MGVLPSSLLSWGLFALVLAGVWVRRSYREAVFRKFAIANHCLPPPSPPSNLPWGIDRIWRIFKLEAAHGDIMETLAMPSFRKLGWTYSFQVPFSIDAITTADPQNMQAILSTKFEDFGIGARRSSAFRYLVGTCIFTVDGPEWARSRALFRPHFARDAVNNLAVTNEAVQDLLTAIHACGLDETRQDDNGHGGWTPAIDMEALFHRFTLDTGAESFLGAHVKSQLAAIPGAKRSENHAGLDRVTNIAAESAGIGMQFADAFQTGSIAVAKRTRLPILAWLVDSRESGNAVRYLQRFVDNLVDAQFHSKPSSEMEENETFLKHLAQYTQDPTELRDQTLFTLVAARDTTAAFLSWLFLRLAKHPVVFNKLRSEIIKTFGTKDDPRDISFYSLKKCQYLQWTMLETLRLHPPGAVNSREAMRDTTLPVGGGPDGKSPIAVRKGQLMILSIYALHRRPDLWGDDALEFRPERWDGRKRDWSFQPFSGGPRTCLGKEYALAEAGFCTVRLLQEFDQIESINDLDTIRQYVSITLEPVDGVKLRLHRTR